jgi:hypothetical protein
MPFDTATSALIKSKKKTQFGGRQTKEEENEKKILPQLKREFMKLKWKTIYFYSLKAYLATLPTSLSPHFSNSKNLNNRFR